MGVKFPHITVKLTGQNGNSFAIIGAVEKALKAADVSMWQIKTYRRRVMSGDYDNLLRVTMETVNVE